LCLFAKGWSPDDVYKLWENIESVVEPYFADYINYVIQNFSREISASLLSTHIWFMLLVIALAFWGGLFVLFYILRAMNVAIILIATVGIITSQDFLFQLPGIGGYLKSNPILSILFFICMISLTELTILFHKKSRQTTELNEEKTI